MRRVRLRDRNEALARLWRNLVEQRLPEAAASRPDWPVRLDPCFARILLDHACGGPWRESAAPPAWASLPDGCLARAMASGESVLSGRLDLVARNRRSLDWRHGRSPRGSRRGRGATRQGELDLTERGAR